MAHNQFGYHFQHNMLRDYSPQESAFSKPDPLSVTTASVHENGNEISPFPPQTPPGMAYVPYQQWETPYDMDTAFPIGTIFPALDYPLRGGGSYA